ncbi:unnamed protein product [Calypogeia fissa]
MNPKVTSSMSTDGLYVWEWGRGGPQRGKKLASGGDEDGKNQAGRALAVYGSQPKLLSKIWSTQQSNSLVAVSLAARSEGAASNVNHSSITTSTLHTLKPRTVQSSSSTRVPWGR